MRLEATPRPRCTTRKRASCAERAPIVRAADALTGVLGYQLGTRVRGRAGRGLRHERTSIPFVDCLKREVRHRRRKAG